MISPQEGDIDPITNGTYGYKFCLGCGHRYFNTLVLFIDKKELHGDICKWCVIEEKRRMFTKNFTKGMADGFCGACGLSINKNALNLFYCNDGLGECGQEARNYYRVLELQSRIKEEQYEHDDNS